MDLLPAPADSAAMRANNAPIALPNDLIPAAAQTVQQQQPQ